VRADRLFHLDLLLAPLFGVEFGAQAAVVLRFLRAIVAFSGNALALTFVVVEALAVPVGWLVFRKHPHKQMIR
jgi:hypothetical protein